MSDLILRLPTAEEVLEFPITVKFSVYSYWIDSSDQQIGYDVVDGRIIIADPGEKFGCRPILEIDGLDQLKDLTLYKKISFDNFTWYYIGNNRLFLEGDGQAYLSAFGDDNNFKDALQLIDRYQLELQHEFEYMQEE